MSLFRRLGDVAKKAKDSLEESGVFEDLKEIAGDTADKVKSTMSATPGARRGTDEAAAEVKVPPGIVNPATIVTPLDVTEVTGIPFDHQHPHHDDEWIGTTITSTDPSMHYYFELRVGRGYENEPFDPDDRWEFLRGAIEAQTELPGLGDQAFRSAPDQIYFRKKDQVAHTLANFGDHPSTAEWCEELARRAADWI